MTNTDKEVVVSSVIALLNSIDVDGETMEHIINEVGMRDQMKLQLGVESRMPEAVIEQIAYDIFTDLDNEGVELIEDQTYGINANEIYIEDVTYDKYRINSIVKSVLESHFTPME